MNLFKKLITFCFSLLFCCTSIWGQCPGGDVILETQLEVDNFAANYPSCTEIIGGLRIGILQSQAISDITDLSNLPPIESIGGSLSISKNPNLTDLSAFENLVSMGGGLSISNNNALMDLSGLENLTAMGGALWITYNDALTDLSGLESLTSMGGGLSISNNNALMDLSGLENLTAVGGNPSTNGELSIRENPNLTDISALESLTSVGSNFNIWNNPNLINLNGLESLTSIGGALNIKYNTNLTNLGGLENLTSIGGAILVHHNDSLINLDSFGSLTSIGSFSKIYDNANLTNISGLENLTSIDRDLSIYNNSSLTNISDFENLTSIGGYLNISNNDTLTDISAFENLTEIGDYLSITSNPNLTDLSVFGNLTSIGDYFNISSNASLTNISGFENLDSIGDYLKIAGNATLTDLSALENLTSIGDYLSIFHNDALTEISGFENLTSIGGGLYVHHNDGLSDLSGLENVTSIGRNLKVYNNATLTDISGLGNLTSIDSELNIYLNDTLTDISGLGNLTSIGDYLRVYDNANLTHISGLGNLDSIGDNLTISNNDNLTDINGLENLTSIGGDLWIYVNDSLADISGLENLDAIGGDLRIYYNPTLSICDVLFICAYLYDEGDANILGNAPGCNSADEILDACSLFRLYTDVFYDLNQNGTKEANEPNYYDASISIMPGDNLFYPQTGIIYVVGTGTYTATLDAMSNPNWQLTTMPSSYTFDLDEGDADTITFGIYPSQQISDSQTIINSDPARCNETITLDATTKNLGTTIANGTMWLTIDDAIPEFNFIQEPDTTMENINTYYGWHFADLYPGQTIIKNVAITIPGPPDFDLGEQLVFESFSEFTDINGEDSSEGFLYNPEVRCSFDPNDKLINPNREGDYVLFEEDLIYTIRFQNTGNDVAYDVVIQDTLDANLDLSTFRLLGSSHANPLNTILNEDEGILTFEFKNIYLPDAMSDFEAGQGYVSYLIRTIDGLAEETPITNSAGIYFDLNPPVITNTTQSIMVSELPTVSTETLDNSFNFNILPNPNTGIFTIQGIPTGTYEILNTSGQIIQQGGMKNNVSFDISGVAQGVYFISVTIDNKTLIERIVKM